MSATANTSTATQSEGELDWIVRTTPAVAATASPWHPFFAVAIESTAPPLADDCSVPPALRIHSHLRAFLA